MEYIFTVLHGMQTQSSDQNFVCQTQIFLLYERLFSLVFGEEEWLVGRPLLPEI